MSGAVFTLGNSVSGSLSLGSALSKFGRVAGQAGFTIEQDEETLNNTVTSRYAGLAAVTVSGVTSVLNPSLVLIPSAYNTSGSTGILYSLHSKPNGVADFVVTRATEGTRFNSVGRISTVGSGDARLDYYTSGGTAGTPALLVEPSGTNLATYSEDWTNYWNTALNVTWSGNVSGTTDPYGTNVADAMFETSATDNHAIFADYSVTSGTTYTFSFFVKPIIARNVRINGATSLPQQSTDVNLSTLAISGDGSGTCRVLNFGNGWARVSQTYTATGTGNGRFIIYSISGTTQSFQGSTNNGLYFFGAQLETGSVATSYIPTTTAAVTRNADVVNLSGAVSGCIGQTEGTIYWEGAINRYDRVFFALASGSSTTQCVRLQTTGAGTMQFIVVSGTIQANIATSGAITLGQFYKVAVAYKENDFVFFLNGAQVGVKDTSGTLPTNLNSVYLLNSNGTEITDQRCRAAALYTTRLTDSELAALTT